jgi:FixJ family two-component response regulator
VSATAGWCRPSDDRSPREERAARIFIIDDDPAVLRALRRLFRAHGIDAETFESAPSFFDRPRCDLASCLILDLCMPGVSGLEVQRMLALRGEEMPIVFLSGRSDVPRTAQAMRNGALDFLVKPVDEVELLAAVTRGLEQCARSRGLRLASRHAAERVARLTRRERDVCELVARGLLNKQIASELGMAEKTVKVHRGRAMRKLQIASVPALVRLLALLERSGSGRMWTDYEIRQAGSP